MIRFQVLFVCFSFLVLQNAFCQFGGYDSAYVEAQPDKFGLRLYLSKKYTDLNVRVPDHSTPYVFKPNSGLNTGVGFTYQNLSINIAFPLSFLNPDRQKNWPFSLDLQSHIYAPKVIVDFFGQFYGGYRIETEDLSRNAEDYLREDMRLTAVGVNFNYLFSGERLSLAAAFTQADIQKKSAYSPFVGFEVYGGKMKGDSLLLPAAEVPTSVNFQEAGYFQAGPNAGMAGTLVIRKFFFLTGVAAVNLSVGYSKWESLTQSRGWGVVPTYYLRGFAGYNGERFSVNVNYVYKNLNLVKVGVYDQAVNTGNYRVNLIYKITPSQKFKKGFKKVNPLSILSKLLTRQ
ncbi:DUF4421 domain-containing protein [Algoriphagus sp. AGSA1]|uniref:DUF4421 domain-containing protein n=1 Tax=Algoriphagus sp. AGSA1 TaxID=2907213 RepID=UPI001F3B42EB|nr:DUF4421 domain-containing protein [Algoriphagus sp. AGSA1]MCE7058043.1 DUF4421 domain-containing protein [Algoriphagus sp. AGSA1]